MAAIKPNKWGIPSTSGDYEFFMQGDTVVSPAVSLADHALTAPSQELSDPITTTEVRKVRGKFRSFQRVIRPAEQTSLSYTLLFPSALYTPALDLARKQSGCPTDFYAVRLCPGDPQYDHAYIYPESYLNPPSEVNDFITTADFTVIQEQTTLTTTERLILWGQHISEVYTTSTSEQFAAAAFYDRECVDCGEDSFVEALVGGGTSSVPRLLDTDDRFANIVALTTGIPANHFITDIWTKGDVVYASFSDSVAKVSGTTGGTTISSDGVNFSLDVNITASMNGVRKWGNLYVTAGGVGAGPALVYTATDGKNYTQVTSTALPNNSPVVAIDLDEANNALYLVTGHGHLYKATYSGGSIVIADITANLPTAPASLRRVSVLGAGHVAVGGTNGYYAESLDGGNEFFAPAITGTGTVAGIAGDRYRTLVGVGSTLYERSILTEYEFSAVTLQAGTTISGNITAITKAPGDNNYFIVTTDAGEVIFTKPFYPDA